MPVELQGERVRLVPAVSGDAGQYQRHWDRPEVRRYLWDDVAVSDEKAETLLAEMLALASYGLGLWTVEEVGAFAGVAGLRRVAGTDLVEVLFSLEPERWGRGLAAETARVLLGHAFGTLGLERVLAGTDLPNARSRAVIDGLGMAALETSPIPGCVYWELNRERFERLEIVTLREQDWPAVRRIYQQGMDTGLATFEVTAPSWEEWDAGHLTAGRLAAWQGAELLGWAALSPISRRACYAGVAEVSLYVQEGRPGRGVGTALLRAVVAESETHGLWTLQGATFAENEVSLRMLARCGFRVVGRRERIARRAGVWRDTVLVERRSSVV